MIDRILFYNILFTLCREILVLSDGGEVALDWAEKDCSITSPIVVVLPGLTGGSQAEYVKILVSAARKNGIRCMIFNNRGLGGLELKVGLICEPKRYFLQLLLFIPLAKLIFNRKEHFIITEILFFFWF